MSVGFFSAELDTVFNAYDIRHTDFVHGLSAASLPSLARDFTSSPLSAADRLRLVHTFVTSSTHDGGLGIEPQTKEWTRVQSVMAIHDKDFNDLWITSWTRSQLGFGVDDSELDKLKDQVSYISTRNLIIVVDFLCSLANLSPFISLSLQATAKL